MGQHLLISPGARLIGQERVLVTWKRLIFPDGTSLSLKDGMPGTDEGRGDGHPAPDQLGRGLAEFLA
jgi:type IV secretory pathway VirB10-like protein